MPPSLSEPPPAPLEASQFLIVVGLRQRCRTYIPGASRRGRHPLSSAPSDGGATFSPERWASQASQAGHQPRPPFYQFGKLSLASHEGCLVHVAIRALEAGQLGVMVTPRPSFD
jgi:hypothetical protein